MKHRLLSALLIVSASALHAAEPPATSRLYAAVGMTKAQKDSSTPLDSGIYVRGADGKWTIFGPRILGVASLTVSPVDPQLMLLAGADGVVRSADAGKTWRRVTGWDVLDVRKIVFDAKDPSKVYAATSWGPLRSTDAGTTWSLAEKGLAKLYTQAIVADRAHSGRVIIGTEDGVYVSSDAAKSWHRADGPACTILRLAQSAADPSLLIAGTQDRGVWLSHDGGKNWKATDPATAKSNMYAVALSVDEPSTMAAGGWETGVRVSADGGKTWDDRSAGLPTRNVFVVVFDPNVKGRLWASTFEEGTFYSDDLGRTWQDGGLYGGYASDFVFLRSAP